MVPAHYRHSIQALEKKTASLEEALANQEHTIREQEKDIVTLKLQVAGLFDRLQNCVSQTVPTVPETVADTDYVPHRLSI